MRRIASRAALVEYLAGFPEGEKVVLQTYCPYEGEAGIFYARRPSESAGRVIGLALRYFPEVIGDGRSTVAELIARDRRLQRLGSDGLHRLEQPLDFIPAVAQKLRLATIGSTRVGGLYRDGGDLITPQLCAAMDAIARDMKEFYFGRFDVRYESVELLRRGNGIVIMEVNCAGSEAIEAWDPALSLTGAFRTIFRKQSLLFKIGADNRRRGFRPIALGRLAKLYLRQQCLIPHYPSSN